MNKWVAKISFKGRQIYLGSYSEYRDAVEAREQVELKYFGFIKNSGL